MARLKETVVAVAGLALCCAAPTQARDGEVLDCEALFATAAEGARLGSIIITEPSRSDALSGAARATRPDGLVATAPLSGRWVEDELRFTLNESLVIGHAVQREGDVFLSGFTGSDLTGFWAAQCERREALPDWVQSGETLRGSAIELSGPFGYDLDTGQRVAPDTDGADLVVTGGAEPRITVARNARMMRSPAAPGFRELTYDSVRCEGVLDHAPGLRVRFEDVPRGQVFCFRTDQNQIAAVRFGRLDAEGPDIVLNFRRWAALR